VASGGSRPRPSSTPAAEPFRWIGDYVSSWLDRAERSNQQGRELIPLARELYASLEVGRATLVHGDFHHLNILRAGDRHLAIDTKAMLGEPKYDVPSFLRNPRSYTMTLDSTKRRLGAFAAVGLNEGRMRVWTLIRLAILGAAEHEAQVVRALLERE
jgi:streptomycin 6-kinase